MWLVALIAGIAGLIAFLMTLRTFFLEVKLSKSNKKISQLKHKISEISREKDKLEARLLEYRGILRNYEQSSTNVRELSSIIKRAKKSIDVCTPQIDAELMTALAPLKKKVRVLTATPRNLDVNAKVAVNPAVDLLLIILDGKKVFLYEKDSFVSIKKTDKVLEGFESLWKGGEAVE